MQNKTDLQGLTFLFHVRIDTEERARNLQIINEYHSKNFTNYKNIYIEDDVKMNVPNLVQLTEKDTYVFSYNSDQWNKCASFNKGITLAKSELIAFHDLDAIISPEQFTDAINQLIEDKDAGLVYPYNGTFLCVNKQLKDEFANVLDSNFFNNYWPERMQVNYNNGNVLVGSLGSVGGCVIGRRDNVIKANGYNPNFKGWGYEDNEFPRRVHIFGFSVTKLSNPKHVLWHLPHDGPGASLKAENPYYNYNHKIVSFIETSSKEEVIKYTKENWTIL